MAAFAEGVAAGDINRLQQAVALYRGSFLEGFSVRDSAAFEEWALFKREQFGRQVLNALRRLAAYHEGRGEYELAQAYAWRQVELEPWQEEAHRQLMRALALGGQRSAALAQYETCRRLLAEELGVEPAAETTRLYEQICDGELESVVISFTPPRPTTNLPTPLVPLVGREIELAAIEGRLRDPACRLLTLLGPGGIGKTHLALEAAARNDGFADGVYLVSLAPLQLVEAIVSAVAEAVGFSFHGGEAEPRQQLLDHLRPKHVLLVMDNYEHLLDNVSVVTDILQAASALKVMTTSRARLNVPGEHVFPVAGLDVPAYAGGRGEPDDATRYSAVELFLQSARRVQPGFDPSPDDLTEVIRICHLVQGLPLGILLAAAWMDMLTPAEIATRIEESLDFLEAGWRDVPGRHTSLRAVFDHSWRLLSAREREVFQALSVLRGGCAWEVAQQVAGATLRELKALVDKSLLQRTPADRYEMHELLRQYAAEKLDQSPSASQLAHDRHSAYFTAALQQWAVDLEGPRQQAVLIEIEADSENVRTAWDWAAAHAQIERLDQALEGVAKFYWSRGRYPEGEAALRTAANKLTDAASQSSARVLAGVLTWQSNFCRLLARWERANQLQQQSLELLEGPELADQDTRRERALLFWIMGHTVLMSDYEWGRQLYEQSLALYRELDDRPGMARALHSLGRTAKFQGAFGQAQAWIEEALAIYRTLDNPRGIATSMANLAEIALSQGRFAMAEHMAREGSVRSRALGNRAEGAYNMLVLGETLEASAKFAEARTWLEECLVVYEDLTHYNYIASARAALGSVALHRGRYEEARAYARTGLVLAREHGPRFRIGFSLVVLSCVVLAAGDYVEAHRLLQQGIAAYQEIGQRADLCWALGILGYAAHGLGHRHQARQCLYEALQIAAEMEAVMPLIWALPAVALLLADQGEKERAVEVYALASRYPLVARSRWFEDVAGRHIAAVAGTLPPGVVMAARERGRDRDLEAVVAELLAELEG
ncbi:MAG: tetratricopeptide repeat protein [Chloroflexi bacterium]|nr:tetratricopeptide repeat protein [Chloroflexota bacterium]